MLQSRVKRASAIHAVRHVGAFILSVNELLPQRNVVDAMITTACRKTLLQGIQISLHRCKLLSKTNEIQIEDAFHSSNYEK